MLTQSYTARTTADIGLLRHANRLLTHSVCVRVLARLRLCLKLYVANCKKHKVSYQMFQNNVTAKKVRRTFQSALHFILW